MTLKFISRERFDIYDFKRFPTFSAKEYYWFADDDANIIGSILLDNYDKDWSFIILAKEEDQTYSIAEIQVSIELEENAVEKLTQKMLKYAEIGKIEKNLYHSNLFDPKSSIIITEMDDVVKKYFRKHPEKMYEMHPSKFEELIASIFKDLGYVECKRYAAHKKVDIGIIRDVAGVQYIHKPSKSIIVTTGYFYQRCN